MFETVGVRALFFLQWLCILYSCEMQWYSEAGCLLFLFHLFFDAICYYVVRCNCEWLLFLHSDLCYDLHGDLEILFVVLFIWYIVIHLFISLLILFLTGPVVYYSTLRIWYHYNSNSFWTHLLVFSHLFIYSDCYFILLVTGIWWFGTLRFTSFYSDDGSTRYHFVPLDLHLFILIHKLLIPSCSDLLTIWSVSDHLLMRWLLILSTMFILSTVTVTTFVVCCRVSFFLILTIVRVFITNLMPFSHLPTDCCCWCDAGPCVWLMMVHCDVIVFCYWGRVTTAVWNLLFYTVMVARHSAFTTVALFTLVSVLAVEGIWSIWWRLITFDHCCSVISFSHLLHCSTYILLMLYLRYIWPSMVYTVYFSVVVVGGILLLFSPWCGTLFVVYFYGELFWYYSVHLQWYTTGIVTFCGGSTHSTFDIPTISQCCWKLWWPHLGTYLGGGGWTLFWCHLWNIYTGVPCSLHYYSAFIVVTFDAITILFVVQFVCHCWWWWPSWRLEQWEEATVLQWLRGTIWCIVGNFSDVVYSLIRCYSLMTWSDVISFTLSVVMMLWKASFIVLWCSDIHSFGDWAISSDTFILNSPDDILRNYL